MKITTKECPITHCPRCGRSKSEAIHAQLEAHECCDDEQCVFKKEIEDALEKANQEPEPKPEAAKPKFTIKPYERPTPKFKIVPLT